MLQDGRDDETTIILIKTTTDDKGATSLLEYSYVSNQAAKVVETVKTMVNATVASEWVSIIFSRVA